MSRLFKSQMFSRQLQAVVGLLFLAVIWHKLQSSLDSRLSLFSHKDGNTLYPVMKDLNLLRASAAELQALLQDGQLTSVQLVKACLAQISKYNQKGPTLRAIYSIHPEDNVLAVAAQLDKERAEGQTRGALHGIPVIVKVRKVYHSRRCKC